MLKQRSLRTSGAGAPAMRISPDRSKENNPRETAKPSVKGLRKTLSVLDM
jgi:hypothetical protein